MQEHIDTVEERVRLVQSRHRRKDSVMNWDSTFPQLVPCGLSSLRWEIVGDETYVFSSNC